MKNLKHSKQTLIANLEPLINDPIKELSRTNDNLAVQKIMTIIKSKLDGLEDGSFFRSNSGHVLYLIESATNVDNLCRMYKGWAPFL